jgi:prepilin-type N-terminal cleavage/methylation domain-containing protein
MKNFTLVELLVVLAITLVFGGLLYTFVSSAQSGDSDYADYSFINPQVETARSQRRMVEEMQRQNDLLQRRLDLLERQNSSNEK